MSDVAGFTGTSRGMTSYQLTALGMLMVDVAELHHGDCVGADAEAHAIAVAAGKDIVIHPPSNDKMRAWCKSGNCKWMAPLPYLKRNHQIVDASVYLIAGPKTEIEELRSGTWATIRYARRIGKRVVLLLPGGGTREW